MECACDNGWEGADCSSESGLTTAVVIGLVVGCVVIVVMFGLLCAYALYKKHASSTRPLKSNSFFDPVKKKGVFDVHV